MWSKKLEIRSPSERPDDDPLIYGVSKPIAVIYADDKARTHWCKARWSDLQSKWYVDGLEEHSNLNVIAWIDIEEAFPEEEEEEEEDSSGADNAEYMEGSYCGPEWRGYHDRDGNWVSL